MAVNETLATVSNDLVYSSMAVYTGAMLVFAAEFAFSSESRARSSRSGSTSVASSSYGGSGVGTVAPPASPAVSESAGRVERLGRIGVALTVLAFVLQAGAVVTRGLSAGRVPWGNMYEFVLVATLAGVGAWLLMLRRRPEIRSLGLFVVTPTLLLLGLAITVLYTDSAELIPALRSYWLVIHVSAAIICAGVFSVGAVASGLYIWQSRRGSSRVSSRLPSLEALDRVAYRTTAFGFPLWTFAVVAGAIWAENAWGRYWGWDPKEVWAFITWVVYAGYLHARATAGWKGTRAAWLCLLGYAVLLFNLFGVNLFFDGLHSYSDV